MFTGDTSIDDDIRIRLAGDPRLLERFNELQKIQRKSKEFEAQAEIDPLTNHYNRRGFLNVLDTVLEEGAHQGTQTAVVFIDLDYFKELNDNAGHAVGDELIIQGADYFAAMKNGTGYLGRSRITQSPRRADDVEKREKNTGRWGGDEFAVVLEDTTPEEAFEFAQGLLENKNNYLSGYTLLKKVGLSIGVAIANGTDAADVIKRADDALYLSKYKGRCRATLWSPEVTKEVGVYRTGVDHRQYDLFE